MNKKQKLVCVTTCYRTLIELPAHPDATKLSRDVTRAMERLAEREHSLFCGYEIRLMDENGNQLDAVSR